MSNIAEMCNQNGPARVEWCVRSSKERMQFRRIAHVFIAKTNSSVILDTWSPLKKTWHCRAGGFVFSWRTGQLTFIIGGLGTLVTSTGTR
jgi:hypothetical protein